MRAWRRAGRTAAVGAIVSAVATAGVLALAPGTASASTTIDCGYSDTYVASLMTHYGDDGSFEIEVEPTLVARVDGPTDELNGSPITIAMWHAIQACVPDLYGDLADSIWQQLECHVWFGPISWETGPTYNLESWHLPLAYPGFDSYYDTKCLEIDAYGSPRVVPYDAYWS